MDNNSQNEEKEDFGEIGDDEEMMKEGEENDNNSPRKNNDDKDKNEDEKNIRKPGEKQKRRSKNECYGRDYKCGCGKEYLSYPALYTHIKTKHDGKTPEGTNANQIQNGKGRGRPRKNFLTNEEAIIRRKRENNRIYNENQSNELKDFLNHRNCSLEYFKKGEIKFEIIYNFFGLLNSKEREKIKKIESNNNNINNINEDNIININNVENKNLLQIDKRELINKINENIEKYNVIDLFTDEMINNSSSYKTLYKCYNELKEKDMLDIEKIEKKESITCDQSFILYLYYISKIITKDFCVINLMVIKHFRDLINILGWNLLSRFKTLDDEDTSKDFCCIKEPLKIPLLASDFCNNYIKKVMKDLDIYFGFIIISHFNFWLYANDLTFIKLNIPNIINEKETKLKEKNDLKNIDNNINEDNNNINDIKNKNDNSILNQ